MSLSRSPGFWPGLAGLSEPLVYSFPSCSPPLFGDHLLEPWRLPGIPEGPEQGLFSGVQVRPRPLAQAPPHTLVSGSLPPAQAPSLWAHSLSNSQFPGIIAFSGRLHPPGQAQCRGIPAKQASGGCSRGGVRGSTQIPLLAWKGPGGWEAQRPNSVPGEAELWPPPTGLVWSPGAVPFPHSGHWVSNSHTGAQEGLKAENVPRSGPHPAAAA